MSDDIVTKLEGWTGTHGLAQAAAVELKRSYAEVARLEATLGRFREHVRILTNRIDFASLPIGECSHCLVGNQPGNHHLPDCPAYTTEDA